MTERDSDNKDSSAWKIGFGKHHRLALQRQTNKNKKAACGLPVYVFVSLMFFRGDESMLVQSR